MSCPWYAEQGSGRDSSSGEKEDQVSQLKHEVFVFKAAAKQLGLLLMLRNKEIEGVPAHRNLSPFTPALNLQAPLVQQGPHAQHPAMLGCTALLQEMQFDLGEGTGVPGDSTGEELDWRRRAAEALQEIHANFTQESHVMSQVSEIPSLNLQLQQHLCNIVPT